jgi:hypothetical protein
MKFNFNIRVIIKKTQLILKNVNMIWVNRLTLTEGIIGTTESDYKMNIIINHIVAFALLKSIRKKLFRKTRSYFALNALIKNIFNDIRKYKNFLYTHIKF